MKQTIKEIFDKCEFCHNSSDVMTFTLKNGEKIRIPGEYIKYRLMDDDGAIIGYRCDKHFSEEECEENPGWECD